MPGKSRARIQAEEIASAEGRDPRPLNKGAYSTAFNIRAYEYCLLGATNDQLATFLRVDPSTIQRWLVERASFRRAVERGREVADAKVARAMYTRATGMTVKKERAFVVRGELKRLFLKEELPPDVNAGALWLSNRQQGKWRSSNAGADATGGFDLAAFVGALGAGIAKGLQQQAGPGSGAEPIEPQDIVFEPQKEG